MQYSLVIIKNYDLLDCIRDYFYQSLMPHGFYSTSVCDKEQLDLILNQLKTSHAVVIEEGMFFKNNLMPPKHTDYDLVGHILDRKEKYYELHRQHFIINVEKWKELGAPSFTTQEVGSVTEVKRSQDNFHDDYTPTWIETKNVQNIKKTKLRYGGHVISEFLKAGLRVRPFENKERSDKNFVYYDESEQISNALSIAHLSQPNSFYYPKATSHKEKIFWRCYPTYLSVANGIESLYRIKNVYPWINEIIFYDVSLPALIFTELLIKKYTKDYKSFVQEYEKETGAGQYNKSYDSIDCLDDYTDPEEILPVLEHIRKNVQVQYRFGDITRTSVIDSLKNDTLINLSNVFQYKFNILRTSEIEYWFEQNDNLDVKTEVLT